MMSATGAAAAKPRAKRARVETVEEEAVVVAPECPPTMEAADFAGLARLKDVFAGDPNLRLLPMPKDAYAALKLEPPRVASMAETAINCFMKPMRETYTSSAVEVRDLRETHTAADFPVFYTGPAHPHMQPEGGARVIDNGVVGATATTVADVDDEMRGGGVPGSAGGFTAPSAHLPAAAGAGAY